MNMQHVKKACIREGAITYAIKGRLRTVATAHRFIDEPMAWRWNQLIETLASKYLIRRLASRDYDVKQYLTGTINPNQPKTDI